MLNITGTRTIDDPEYRYKMPAMAVSKEGKGRTVISNLNDIGFSLNRNAKQIAKFLGYELGTRCEYDSTTGYGLINGPHSASRLQQLLAKYIDEYVLCVGCGKPETVFIVESNTVYQNCLCCPCRSDNMSSSKLSKYILNEFKQASDKESREQVCGRAFSAGSPAPLYSALSAVGGQSEKLSAEKEDLKGVSLTFRMWIQSSMTSLATTKIMHQLSSLLWHNELNERDRIVILMFSAFGPDSVSNQNCLLCRDILKQMVTSSADRSAVIKGAVLLALAYRAEILPKLSILFEQCYDLDLVEEDEFLKWDDDLTNSLNRAECSGIILDVPATRSDVAIICEKAIPFITWLRQAETDEDEN